MPASSLSRGAICGRGEVRMDARRALAAVRRYQAYEALRPLTCPQDIDHYLLEPAVVSGDVLLICPTCGFADLLEPGMLSELDRRGRLAGAFWRGLPV